MSTSPEEFARGGTASTRSTRCTYVYKNNRKRHSRGEQCAIVTQLRVISSEGVPLPLCSSHLTQFNRNLKKNKDRATREAMNRLLGGKGNHISEEIEVSDSSEGEDPKSLSSVLR